MFPFNIGHKRAEFVATLAAIAQKRAQVEALFPILVAVLEPDGAHLEMIPNTPQAKEALIGGFMKAQDIGIEGAMALTNATGFLSSAPINRTNFYSGEQIVGTFLIVASDGGSLTSDLVDSIELMYDELEGRALLSF